MFTMNYSQNLGLGDPLIYKGSTLRAPYLPSSSEDSGVYSWGSIGRNRRHIKPKHSIRAQVAKAPQCLAKLPHHQRW